MALYVVEPWKYVSGGGLERANHRKHYWMEGAEPQSLVYDHFNLHRTLKVYKKPSLSDLEAIHVAKDPAILLQMGKPVGTPRWSREQRTSANPGGLLAPPFDTWVIDIDKNPEWIDLSPLSASIREMALEIRQKAGLPSCGMFVARSSSAYVNKPEYVTEGIPWKLHIFIPLARDYSQEEMEHCKEWDFDHSTLRPNQPIYTHLAELEDDVPRLNLVGPDYITIDGHPLRLEDLPERPPEYARYIPVKGKNGKGGGGGEIDNKFFNEVLINRWGQEIPWGKLEDIVFSVWEYVEERIKKDGTFDGRRALHRGLARYCYKHSGSFDLYEQILGLVKDGDRLRIANVDDGNNLRGKWDERDLLSHQEQIRAYYKDKWRGGDITAYEFDARQEVSSGSMGEELSATDYLNKDISLFFATEGTGKTALIKEIKQKLTPETSLTVSHSQATAKIYAKELNQTDYQNVGLYDYTHDWSLSQRKEHFMGEEAHLSTCLDSLYYVFKGGNTPTYELVVLDEIEHILERLVMERGAFGGELSQQLKRDNYSAIMEVCAKADKVIVADAKASNELTGFFLTQLGEYTKKKTFLLQNNWDWMAHMDVALSPSVSSLLDAIKRALEEGRNIAIHTDFADKAEKPEMQKWQLAIAAYCGIEKKHIEYFTSASFENNPDHEMRTNANEYISTQQEKGTRVFMCSPWSNVGWQYNGKGIEETFGIYINSFVHAEDIKQALRRWRITGKHTIYVSRRQIGWNEKGKDKIEGFIRDPYKDINLQGTYLDYCRRMSVKSHLINVLEDAGAQIKYLKEGSNEARQVLSEAATASKEEAYEDLNNSAPIKDFTDWKGNAVQEISEASMKAYPKWKRHRTHLFETLVASEAEISEMEEKYPELHWRLQRKIVERIDELIKPYNSGSSIFEWLAKSDEPLRFHIKGTKGADKFEAWIKRNLRHIEKTIDVPMITGKKWRESPRALIQIFASALFLECSIHKQDGQKLAQIKQRCKQEGITYKGRTVEAKEELLGLVQKQKDYGPIFRCYGDWIELKKRPEVNAQLFWDIKNYASRIAQTEVSNKYGPQAVGAVW